MKIKLKKLHPDAVVPKYANLGDSGFDLVALENVEFSPGETKLIRTGLSMAVPMEFELQIRPRSGLSLKTPLRVANSPGTCDSSYTGEICVIMTNTATPMLNAEKGYYDPIIVVRKGDRIAQGVICPVRRVEFEVVESLDETERGSNGFGSSGV
jgi:dUTP pyrophosphatase